MIRLVSILILCLSFAGAQQRLTSDRVAISVPGEQFHTPGANVIDADIRPLRRSDWNLDVLKDAASDLPLSVNSWYLPLKVNSVLVLPGDTLRIRINEKTVSPGATLIADESRSLSTGFDSWQWVAPSEQGFYAFQVTDGPQRSTHVNVFVGVPRESIRDGKLQGYPIGTYRKRPENRGPSYTRPAVFVGIASADEDILVSPHFSVADFLCKEPGNPRFAVTSTNVINKLEALLVEVRLAGIDARTLTVMSGYRTPGYNRKIGNTTTLSRHLYGDAADVFVDLDGNSWMDDIDGDGKINIGDAQYLSRLMESAIQSKRFSSIPGGMKTYRPNAVRGPFLHVDTRGTRARW